MTVLLQKNYKEIHVKLNVILNSGIMKDYAKIAEQIVTSVMIAIFVQNVRKLHLTHGI
jgi:hypothetical protein